MTRVSQEQIQNAKQYDLMTYFQCAKLVDKARI